MIVDTTLNIRSLSIV